MTHLFVYGTLMPGEERWHFLEPFVEGPGVPATISGALYDSGLGYPVVDATEAGEVPGMLFALRAETEAEALEVLDEVEDVVIGEYARVRVDVQGTTAWTYVGALPELKVTRIDRWPLPD